MNFAIIFIPGLKGSKLYSVNLKKNIWPPSIGALVRNLYFPLCRSESNLLRELLDMNNNVIPNGLVEQIGHIDIYKTLIKLLRSSYGEHFLTFSYDWRQSIHDISLKLKQFVIENVKNNTNVYLIGHSFGGLVARYMLENKSIFSNLQANFKFLLLIALGTPHNGSLAAVSALLGLSSTSVTNQTETELLSCAFNSVYELIPFAKLNDYLKVVYKKYDHDDDDKKYVLNLKGKNDLFLFKLITEKFKSNFPHLKWKKVERACKTIGLLNYQRKPVNCKYMFLNANGGMSLEYIELNLTDPLQSQLFYSINTGDGVVGIMTPTKLQSKSDLEYKISVHADMCTQSHVLDIIAREINCQISNNVALEGKNNQSCSSASIATTPANYPLINQGGNVLDKQQDFQWTTHSRTSMTTLVKCENKFRPVFRKYFGVILENRKSKFLHVELTRYNSINNEEMLLQIRLLDAQEIYSYVEIKQLNGQIKLHNSKVYPLIYSGNPITYFQMSTSISPYIILLFLTLIDCHKRLIRIIQNSPGTDSIIVPKEDNAK